MSTSDSSNKRSKSSKKASSAKKSQGPKAIDAPFDKKTLDEAREIALSYTLVLERTEDGVMCYSVELPYSMALGDTPQAAMEEGIEITATTVACMLEAGESPPVPATGGKRDQQVNIRLTAQEKFRLEHMAQREGYRSLSDFIRAAAMQRAG